MKHVLILLLVALVSTSCGMFSKKSRQTTYYDVQEAVPLTIPEGLDSPATESALRIDYPPMPLPQTVLSDVPPRVLANQQDAAGNSRIKWSADGVYILVQDSPESVERRLGFVIERSGMDMVARNPDGSYRFQYEHARVDDGGFFNTLYFWRDDAPDYSGTYETLAQPDGAGTRVFVIYADGGEVPMDAAEHVLALLKERLG